MHILLAVVEDLVSFALYNSKRLLLILPIRSPHRQSSLMQYEEHLTRASTRLPAVSTPRSSVVETTKLMQEVMWTSVSVAVYVGPAFAVDTKIGHLPLGERVRTGTVQSGWVWVTTPSLSGWVLASTLTDDQETITPNFANGDSVAATEQSVRLVREYIYDEFAAGVLGVPLLDIEYAYYRLLCDGKQPLWPSDRPRLAGSWQHLLRGKTGVHVSVFPATGSIIEYVDSPNDACVAYVEAVYPDNRIKLAGVYGKNKTCFSREELSHEVWREWRPVFISFS